MIPIHTELQPRDPSDPVVTVCGVEGQRHILTPVEFGTSPFALTYDELTSAYDCTGHTVQIEPLDESARWRELSKIKFTGLMQDQPRKRAAQEALPSAEEFFAEASQAVIDANVAATGKLRKRS
jgi:hypothetical protein